MKMEDFGRSVLKAAAFAAMLCAAAANGQDARSARTLWDDFADPPDAAKPWAYYLWQNGLADRETITADLEAMKRLGFGGINQLDTRGYWDDEEHVVIPKAEIVWGSPEWYDLVEFCIRECARLGLEFTMNVAASGGSMISYVDGKPHEADVLDRNDVVAHLDRVLGPILKRVPELVGTTFTHIYSVSYEGNVKTGGSWRTIKDNFYATMREWAHGHGLKIYSESGGPWAWGSKKTPLDCDQLDLLAHNDFPQGEFWPVREQFAAPDGGRANANGRIFQRGIVLSARREGRRIVSMEAFTHMHRHYSVDPAFLKPLADVAFADGANRMVWHTFTSSPKKFGVPGSEYFAGSHINRNVTWHKDAAAFVKYLGRCQALLQRGEYVDDGEFVSVATNYYGWGRFRKDVKAQFTKIHRREGNVDFFFVAGEGKGEVVLNAAANGRSVEIWDPVTATRTMVGRDALIAPQGGKLFTNGNCHNCSQMTNGKTRIALDLPVGGSCFVVFAPSRADDGRAACPHAAARSDAMNCVPPTDVMVGRVVPNAPQQIPLTNAWQVSFAYHDGISAAPPAPMTMETLRDWTTYDGEGAVATSLRYFSGTATYRTTFSIENNTNNCKDNLALNGSQPRADSETAHSCARNKESCFSSCSSCFQTILSLGELPSGTARVFVNGKDCGVVWCAPWEADVSSALRAGENEIEIRYTNNWYNRLVGDCFLPAEDRVTRSTLRYWNVKRGKTDPKRPQRVLPTNCSGPSVSDPLQPSGLLGPVAIKARGKVERRCITTTNRKEIGQ